MPMMYITELCYEFKSILVREIRLYLAFEKAWNLHKIYKKYKRQIMEKSSFFAQISPCNTEQTMRFQNYWSQLSQLKFLW